MRLAHHRLRAKGWTDEEIQKAHVILDRAEGKKHLAYRFLEKAVFWGLLFLTLVSVFVTSIVIIPLLLVLPDSVILIVLALFGLIFGSLFTLVISDIEWLERRHHLVTAALLALVALSNVLLIDGRARSIVGDRHHTLILGLVFALVLVAPYLFHTGLEVRRWT